MQKRGRWLVASLLLAAAVATPALARGNGKVAPTVQCTQAGLTVDSVVAGSQFAIEGESFTPGRVVLVCFSGEYCRYSQVESDGSFYQTRVISEPASYTLTVRESRNQKLDRSVLKVTSELVVTDAY